MMNKMSFWGRFCLGHFASFYQNVPNRTVPKWTKKDDE